MPWLAWHRFYDLPWLARHRFAVILFTWPLIPTWYNSKSRTISLFVKKHCFSCSHTTFQALPTLPSSQFANWLCMFCIYTFGGFARPLWRALWHRGWPDLPCELQALSFHFVPNTHHCLSTACLPAILRLKFAPCCIPISFSLS